MNRAPVQRLNNILWERRLGISTRGVVPIEHRDSVHYATMGYSIVWRVLRHLGLGASDVFVDVGCGKGRMLCCAAQWELRGIIGVDLSAPLCAIARGNADGLRHRRAPIQVVNEQAEAFDYSSATVLFMFDPFGANTMRAVLRRVREHSEGRSVRMAYAHPTQAAVFREQSWLEETDLWDRDQTGLEHSVVFYRSSA